MSFVPGKPQEEYVRACTSVHNQANDDDGEVWDKRQKLERGYSSAGRAPALHAGGQQFDPA